MAQSVKKQKLNRDWFLELANFSKQTSKSTMNDFKNRKLKFWNSLHTSPDLYINENMAAELKNAVHA